MRELRKMADRIQARAIQRCGELLREIEPAPGANQNIGEGARPKVQTRKDAATAAGLSEYQRKTALRVANVPPKEFEEAIESDNPPTVTALAERGKAKATAHLKGRLPEDFAIATALLGLLHHIVRVSEQIDLSAAIRGLDGAEMMDARDSAAKARQWFRSLEDHDRRSH
jgi:hypothetical protein